MITLTIGDRVIIIAPRLDITGRTGTVVDTAPHRAGMLGILLDGEQEPRGLVPLALRRVQEGQ